MKKTKRTLMLHSLYDHTGIARYLEDQAARGWRLEKLGLWGWVFRRAEPKRLHYAVTYFPKASVYDPGPSEDQQVLQDYCAAAGWELVTTSGQMQIFVSEAEDPPPVETDPAVQVANIHRAMKRSFLPSYLVLMGLSGLMFAMLLWQLWTDPIDLLTSTSNFFTAFFWTLLFVLCLVEVLGYLRWHRRARLAARDGQFLPVRSHNRFQRAAFALVILGLAAWVLASVLDSRRAVVFALCGVVYAAVLFGSIRLITWFLKRRKVSAKVNRIVTLLSSAAVSFLCITGLALGVVRMDDGWLGEHQGAETYTWYGMTWDVYHDQLPLTVEDLTDVAGTDWYSYEWSGDTSPLLAQMECRQRPRLDAPETPRLPELEYELLKVRVSFFYDLCKEDFIRQAERHNDELPREYWEVYEPVASTPWGAEDVYRLYRSGKPSSQYLVCWPDRILEIDFGWTPTAEQCAAAAEKLRNV